MSGKIATIVTVSLLLGAAGVSTKIQHTAAAGVAVPHVPDTGVATTSAPIPKPPVQEPPAPAPVSAPDYPVRLVVPSIKLNAPIEKVGVTGDGSMDVPSGATKNVGWYQWGAVPGSKGSAVIDAHVFAAFAKLQNLAVGSDIYVVTAANKTLHFKVEERELYPFARVPLEQLFNRSDEARLNLITCAGKLTPDHTTYDHRLVVYAVLVS